MTAAAFKACYAEWKVIKTRAAVQLVFEIPIEQSDAAYQALGGMPIAAKEVWCGIARIDPEAANRKDGEANSNESGSNRSGSDSSRPDNTTPRPSVVPASAAGADNPKLRKSWVETPYVTQVAIRCGEIMFCVFLHEYCGVKPATAGGPACSSEDAAAFVRKHCRVSSRKEILPGTEAETYWKQIEEWFAVWRVRDRVA